MTFDDFCQMLVAESEADGNTTWLEGLLAEAKSKMTEGKGSISTITNATLNGKTFERRFQFAPVEVVRACRRALNILNDADDTVPCTTASFRNLNR